MFKNDFLFFGVFSFSAILFIIFTRAKANKQKKKGIIYIS
jgi:hypothetical protein